MPGFDQIGLERYLTRQVAAMHLPGWRFQPAGLHAEPAPNRLQWSFRLNPYAGGTARRIGPGGTAIGLHRYVTVEVRLYLGGDYQTLSSGQTELEGGTDDAKLGALVDTHDALRHRQRHIGPGGAAFAGLEFNRAAQPEDQRVAQGGRREGRPPGWAPRRPDARHIAGRAAPTHQGDSSYW